MMKVLVCQTFETLGGPFEEIFSTMEEAEEYADTLAFEMAAALYRVLPNGEVEIPFYSPYGKTGHSNEIEWHSRLSDDAGAEPCEDYDGGVPGSLSLEALAKRIRNDAIEIMEFDDTDNPQHKCHTHGTTRRFSDQNFGNEPIPAKSDGDDDDD